MSHQRSHTNYYEDIQTFLKGKAPLFEKELTLLRKIEERERRGGRPYPDDQRSLTRITSQGGVSNYSSNGGQLSIGHGINSNNQSSSAVNGVAAWASAGGVAN